MRTFRQFLENIDPYFEILNRTIFDPQVTANTAAPSSSNELLPTDVIPKQFRTVDPSMLVKSQLMGGISIRKPFFKDKAIIDGVEYVYHGSNDSTWNNKGNAVSNGDMISFINVRNEKMNIPVKGWESMAKRKEVTYTNGIFNINQ